MPRHADATRASVMVGQGLRAAITESIITNAIVAASNTVAALKTAVRATTGIHADKIPLLERTVDAIEMGENIGDFTDALLAPLTTTNGLLDLTAYGSTGTNSILVNE